LRSLSFSRRIEEFIHDLQLGGGRFRPQASGLGLFRDDVLLELLFVGVPDIGLDAIEALDRAPGCWPSTLRLILYFAINTASPVERS